ncbi:hypothetical protein Droror1_Dr00011155 [Drosera rotundifolia]
MQNIYQSMILVFALILFPVVNSQSSNYDQYVAPDDGGNLTPSLAILFGILFCAFLLTGLLSLYIHHWCANTLVLSRADSADNASRFLPISITGNTGLDKSVVESFPMVVYSKKSKAGMECAVCLSEFGDGETLRMLPKCNHAFHPDCIGGWLVSHSTCPVCRADLTKLALATTAVDADDVELDSIQVEIVGSESTSVVNVKVIGEKNEIVNRSDSSGGESVSRPGGVRRAASFPMLSSLRCGYRNSGETSGGGGGVCGQSRLPV